MVAKLLIDVPSAHWAYTVLLDPEREYTFGTSRENFFPLPPGTASPRHALLAWNHGWTVHDCGSETGTLVNGRPVTSHSLHHRDVLRIGTAEAIFQFPEQNVDARERDSTHQIVEGQQSALEEVAGKAQQQELVTSGSTGGGLAWAAGQLARIMSEVLSSPGSREETYRLILKRLRDAVGADNGFVMIADHDNSRWVIRAWAGDNSSWTDYEKSHPLPLSVTNRAYETKSVVSNALLEKELEDPLNSPSMQALNVNGYIAVPLLQQNRCRGVLYFDTRNPARKFLPRDARLLELAANCILGIEDQKS